MIQTELTTGMPAPLNPASASAIARTTPPTQTQFSGPVSGPSQSDPATSSQCISAIFHAAVATARSFRVSNPPSLF